MGKGWEYKLDVSDIFHGEDEAETMRLVSQRVERYQSAAFPVDDEFELLADELVDAAHNEDIAWFDQVWDAIYDWADANRVWIKTV